jgi:hypothetical protein
MRYAEWVPGVSVPVPLDAPLGATARNVLPCSPWCQHALHRTVSGLVGGAGAPWPNSAGAVPRYAFLSFTRGALTGVLGLSVIAIPFASALGTRLY